MKLLKSPHLTFSFKLRSGLVFIPDCVFSTALRDVTVKSSKFIQFRCVHCSKTNQRKCQIQKIKLLKTLKMCWCGVVVFINMWQFIPGVCREEKKKGKWSRLEDEAMKSCNNFYSSCLPFIFGSQAGIGSDYSLKQHGRNDSTNISRVHVARVYHPLNWSHLGISHCFGQSRTFSPKWGSFTI